MTYSQTQGKHIPHSNSSTSNNSNSNTNNSYNNSISNNSISNNSNSNSTKTPHSSSSMIAVVVVIEVIQ